MMHASSGPRIKIVSRPVWKINSQVRQVEQVEQVKPIRQVEQVEQVSQTDHIKPVNQVNRVNQADHIKPVNQVGQANRNKNSRRMRINKHTPYIPLNEYIELVNNNIRSLLLQRHNIDLDMMQLYFMQLQFNENSNIFKKIHHKMVILKNNREIIENKISYLKQQL